MIDTHPYAPPREAPACAPVLAPSERAYAYDGTFDGWLCVVFHAYQRRETPARIEADAAGGAGLFGDAVRVETDAALADRVRAGIARRAGWAAVDTFHHALLSEAPGIGGALFRLAVAVFGVGAGAMEDLRFEPALLADRLARRVRSEVHRMHAFVRFERRAGDVYVARIRPDFHVLPLLAAHFEARYPAQRWAIVDAGRGLALLHEPEADGLAARTLLAPAAGFDALDETPDEAAYRGMWRAYFHAVNIPERRNERLQRRHMPRRYWPFLSEKEG